MAEVVENTNVAENNATTQEPSVSELMERLAAVEAERDRNKTALDKALKDNGNLTKSLRAKQSEEEQKAEADAEAKKLMEEELENLRAENNRNRALSAYKSLDEKTVDKLIEAVANADHSAIAKIFEAEVASAVKKAEAVWLDGRPRVNAGVGGENAMTKKDIMAIKDTVERQRLIAENIHLFGGN